MHWASFLSASILFAFAGAGVWTAVNRRALTNGPQRQEPSFPQRLARRMSGTHELNAPALWWFCAQFALLGTGAALNGFAHLARPNALGWSLTVLALLSMASGLVAGVVALRKRSEEPRVPPR
ncbi:hypothetical protein [Cryptosporangium minutisporangium]|uniref:SdpI family protein n=1 Tax=Cryptosporangium minutisporangium TaxID=113569 RepID=A0ABP6SZR8_9ACTN